ncbi:dihydrodipicolinate reductase [Aquihabitans sp. McL0605]|uniref:NAD(P)H-dependent amine dehydrogenase family protein n=1 Tax=Aquihabitans sp. McL0605 TaxID=3415671 RepID=UPI003CEB246E
MSAVPLRVVQWSTGNIGTRSLQGVIGHPGMELVGVYVHGDDKAGRDAGDLCDRPATGVIATSDIDEIVALGADCVLYMPNACDFDVVCRLLASGANVVTTRGEFHRPASLVPELRERVEEACAAGGTSIHSTGSSPGFISEAIPLVVTSIQRRLDALTIDEFADLSKRDSPELLFDIMGFGKAPSTFDEGTLAYLRDSFGPSLQVVAEALSIPLDELEATGEVATAPHPIEIAAGTIETGTVAAQRISVTGSRDGRPLLRFRATWYCSTELEPAWKLLDTGWHVSVEGDAPLEIELRMPIPLERMAETTPGYTANRAVNSVAVVCGAAPGIRTTPELPPVLADLS